MRIRIMQYSLSLKDIIIGAVSFFIVLSAMIWAGLIYFIAIVCSVLGGISAIRCFIFWLIYDGPDIKYPRGETIYAICMLIVASICFLLSK